VHPSCVLDILGPKVRYFSIVLVSKHFCTAKQVKQVAASTHFEFIARTSCVSLEMSALSNVSFSACARDAGVSICAFVLVKQVK
jgi:hypothetical protein